MGEHRRVGMFCLVCFLCLLCTTTAPPGQGMMIFAAEGKQVKQLFGALKKPVVNPPLGSYKANYDHYIESNQKTGPRHSKNTRVSPPIPQQVRGTSTTWCVVKPSTSQEKLDQIIGYCCTQPRVDCKAIQAGGMCYLPPNKVSDASVVMNIYYSLNGKKPSSCSFEGSGLVVAQDPSVGKCIYQV